MGATAANGTTSICIPAKPSGKPRPRRGCWGSPFLVQLLLLLLLLFALDLSRVRLARAVRVDCALLQQAQRTLLQSDRSLFENATNDDLADGEGRAHIIVFPNGTTLPRVSSLQDPVAVAHFRLFTTTQEEREALSGSSSDRILPLPTVTFVFILDEYPYCRMSTATATTRPFASRTAR